MTVLPGAALSRDCFLPNSPCEQHPRSKCTELLSSDCLFMLSQDCDNLCYGVHSEVGSLLPLRPLCLRPCCSAFCPLCPLPVSLALAYLPSYPAWLCVMHPHCRDCCLCAPLHYLYLTPSAIPPPPPLPPDVCHQGAVLHCNRQEFGGTPLAVAVALYALSGLYGMGRPRIGAAG